MSCLLVKKVENILEPNTGDPVPSGRKLGLDGNAPPAESVGKINVGGCDDGSQEANRGGIVRR